MKRTLLTRTVLAAALALGAAGCGVPEAVVGIHDAPREKPATAPLNAEGAAQIVARVLDDAAAARAATGPAAEKLQAAALTGTARVSAQIAAKVAAKTGTGTPSAEAPLQRAEPPKVLAVSRGQQWPRAILASTLDATTNQQYLHALVSAAPAEPFRLAASVPMLAGAALPSLGEFADGAPLVASDDKEGRVSSPAAALTDYAAALAYPTPKPSAVVATTDQFATGLKSSLATQVKSLGKLATLTQVHNPVPKDLLSFELADGGAVVFARMDRADTIKLKPEAKELVLPPLYAKLAGQAKVTNLVAIQGLEELVLVVPAQGKVSVIGAEEQLSSGLVR